uniref:RING finger protein 145-like n=1 Tax=Crassostrea virginica TaxID=6565 RepID=A0A8B8EJJ1_CRAVI|nr:RING finger protein 145-like [Crassostrea virginica]
MLLLQQDQLLKLYWNLTIGILLLYMPSKYVQQEVVEPTLNGIKINDVAYLKAYLLCTATGLLAIYLFQEKTWKGAALMVNNLPVATVVLRLPSQVTQFIQGFTMMLILCYLSYRVSLSVCRLIDDLYLRINLAYVFGFYNVTKHILDSIQQQFLVFWLATLAYSAAFPAKETAYVIWNMSWSDWITFLSTCVAECCRTLVGLMATSVFVTHATGYARVLLEAFLYGFRRTGRHDETGGLAEGVVFFLLSIRFGVAEKHNADAHLDVQRRLFLLQITFFAVVAVFLNTTYQILDAKIVFFSASTKISNHIRAYMTYILLLLSSCYVMYTVLKLVDIGTVLAFLIITGSTFIQIVGSLLVYTLFLYDVKYSIDNLDDTIFYMRASVNILVFVGSIFAAGIGLWVLKVEGLGWIQTPCLIIHIYYQVWNEFKDGYDAFILRRNCEKKINSLTWATNEEVCNYGDVCSICYQGMSSAKITPCGHLYHRNCLRKWINDNNTCPLCSHRISV